MSEIVRPTRDGIHGREYISTSVDIGPKPMRLSFAPDGRMLSAPSHLLEVQIPVVLDVPHRTIRPSELARARAIAAEELKTVAVVPVRDAMLLEPELRLNAVPLVGSEAPDGWMEEAWKMVQLTDRADVVKAAAQLRLKQPKTVISVRMDLSPDSGDRILELSRGGLKVFHLCADQHGKEFTPGSVPGRHIKDVLRELHTRLVNEGIRDEVTLIISGGIALAEHMAKAIICGADLVAADTVLLVALGCQVCPGTGSGSDGFPACGSCPAEIDSVDSIYAAQRMVNLMGAWHSQLIEVLGAMGIREVRRLRGEMGRAIFMEEIEREAFGELTRVSREVVNA
jgi:hypothetical protein